MSDNRLKRTAREDDVARATRLVRDQYYRRCGYNANDKTYRAIVAALAQVRVEARKS